MTDLTGFDVEGVTGLVLLPLVKTAHTFTLDTPLLRLRGLDAVLWEFWAAYEVTADPTAPRWTRTLGAAVVHEVSLSLRYFSVLEARVHTVVELIPFTQAASL